MLEVFCNGKNCTHFGLSCFQTLFVSSAEMGLLIAILYENEINCKRKSAYEA